MTTVFIIHGAYGNPEENWFLWLKEKLTEMGCVVFTPTFPTPKDQSLDNWLKALKPFEGYIDEDTIFVGHSLGSTFILSVLEKLSKKVKGTFLVAGFIGPVRDSRDTMNRINSTFCDRNFKWDKIKGNCGKFVLINSDNDPYVPLEIAENVSRPLGVPLTIIRDAGHFNKDSGYTRFPELLDMIEDLISFGQVK